MKRIIKTLLRESLLNEAKESTHIFDRLKNRINKLSDNEVSSFDKGNLEEYLNILSSIDFSLKQSFAIKVMDLKINKKSDLFYSIGGREYYRIMDFLGNDSTGNEIWVIIRQNKAVTIMLRKDIQPKEKLRTDYVINNISELQDLFKTGLIRESLNNKLVESLYDRNLEQLAHGQSKVRTRNIFAKPNPHGTSYNSNFQEIVNSIGSQLENPTNAHKERVKLEDIAPTQRFISIDNLERVSDVSRDTNAILVLINGIYYAIDGHHRIVNRILEGDSFIIAYVIKPENN